MQSCIKVSTQEMLVATGRARLWFVVLMGSRTTAGKHRIGLMIKKGRGKVMKSLLFFSLQ